MIQPLSSTALEVLRAIFDEKSNIQLPIAVAEQIVEIRQWVKETLEHRNDESGE